jgi:hypothetical protein
MERVLIMASAFAACLAILAFLLLQDTYAFQLPLFSQSDHHASPVEDGQSSGQTWNILYHLGGNSPWIPKLDGLIESDISPPPSCKVEQVHMVGLNFTNGW